MILALTKQKADTDSCYYIALVQPIIVSLYISCTACDLTKPSCMPCMEFGPKPELHAWHDMWVKTKILCPAGSLANFMPGMKFNKFQISCRSGADMCRFGTELFTFC